MVTKKRSTIQASKLKERMRSPIVLEKDSSPPIAEVTDCHTKKVKVREKQDDPGATEKDKGNMESMEVNMEDVGIEEGLTEGISFKDKLWV